ncbi:MULTISPECIES: hypothetical protein [Mucilaginibacter]|uniref:hypothetical protein n=1 Tax=Mucilaginibacter TaxID=423349 RepID=UPI00159E70D1|nr:MULTISPECIES: hypothetical protein [Mucilaginibacter]NVM63756.1 hypothetical protein [Mucilaginibacter sp. SG538B]
MINLVAHGKFLDKLSVLIVNVVVTGGKLTTGCGQGIGSAGGGKPPSSGGGPVGFASY